MNSPSIDCGDTLLPENVRTHIPKGIIIERRLFEVFVRILGGMGCSWFLVGVRLAVTRTERCGTRKSAHKMNKQLLDLQLTLLSFKQPTDWLRQRMRSCQKGSGSIYSVSPSAAALRRRWRTASARSSTNLRVSSQPTHASVMLKPYTSSLPGIRS